MVIMDQKKIKYLINIPTLTKAEESDFYLFSEWDTFFFVSFLFLSSSGVIPG